MKLFLINIFLIFFIKSFAKEIIISKEGIFEVFFSNFTKFNYSEITNLFIFG